MGLSCLRYHNKCHNFIDTPSDKCLCNHGTEDTYHYIFLCPFFAAQRATLASSVIQILQKYNLNHLGNQSHLYLYGQPTVNFADNRKILLSTIKYMKETQRFQRTSPLPKKILCLVIITHNHIIFLVNSFFVSICMRVLYLSLYLLYSLVL